jgi:TrmH family RNA methyltransferase
VTLVVRGASPAPPVAELARRIEAASTPGFKRIELPAALYDAISPVEHGAGALAEIATPEPPSSLAAGEDAVYLDGIQDPGNVGTLLRTAAAAGVRQAVVGPGSAYAWSPKVLRAAMGAHFALSIVEDAPVSDIARAFRGAVIAADLEGDDLYAAEWGRGPTLWLFGSEGRGLGAEARAAARLKLRIPLAAGVESLNVAAAAAVCLFEQARRRRAFRRQ